jgi:hypothetical protein
MEHVMFICTVFTNSTSDKQMALSIINKAIMGPLTEHFFFSSSDVIAITCFGHTIIIKWHTVVYCRKLFAWLQ